MTWVVSLFLLLGYLPDRAGFQFVETVDWIPIFGIQYKLGADGLSVALVVLTTTLSWISILASFKPIQTRIKEYMISFLVLEVGLIGVFLALDTFLFYIFWEIVLVPMYLIIGIWGGANRIYATIKFVLYTLVGSLLMLVAILATAYAYPGRPRRLVGRAPSTSRPCGRTPATGGFADGLQLLAFVAFFLAFAIKVPMFPMRSRRTIRTAFGGPEPSAGFSMVSVTISDERVIPFLTGTSKSWVTAPMRPLLRSRTATRA